MSFLVLFDVMCTAALRRLRVNYRKLNEASELDSYDLTAVNKKLDALRQHHDSSPIVCIVVDITLYIRVSSDDVIKRS